MENNIKFLLVAANQNAINVAKRLGIPTESAITFKQEEVYINNVMNNVPYEEDYPYEDNYYQNITDADEIYGDYDYIFIPFTFGFF